MAGFTLLEILVALAIFGVISAAGYLALDQGLRFQERLEGQRAFWSRMEAAFHTLHRDLSHVRDRVPRGSGRGWSDPFEGPSSLQATREGTLFRFTRGGRTSFRKGPVSPLQPVAYRFREGKLIRAVWARVDAPSGQQPTETVLLDGLEEVEVRFLAGEDEPWLSQWPPEGVEDLAGLPRVAELTLEFEDRGLFRRLFYVGAPR